MPPCSSVLAGLWCILQLLSSVMQPSAQVGPIHMQVRTPKPREGLNYSVRSLSLGFRLGNTPSPAPRTILVNYWNCLISACRRIRGYPILQGEESRATETLAQKLMSWWQTAFLTGGWMFRHDPVTAGTLRPEFSDPEAQFSPGSSAWIKAPVLLLGSLLQPRS